MSTEKRPGEDGSEGVRVTLSAADAAAVDAIVESRGEGAGGPTLTGLIQAEMGGVDAARLARAQAWVDLIKAGATVPEVPGDLVERTLAAVKRELMKLAPAGAGAAAAGGVHTEARVPRRWSRRVGEYAAMAVAAGILVAVIIPGIATARKSARRVACASNLVYVSQAFTQYAKDDAGELPALAMPADGNWLPQGPGLRPVETAPVGHSNAANLLPLINAHYMTAARLLCAGRSVPESATIDLSGNDVPENVRGYSYVNMYGEAKPKWDEHHATIVLADRNPLFGSYVTDNVHANSFNHGATGNYVVRADGAISWETSPDVGPGGDNIWTIGKQDKRVYMGTETVTLAGDVFLSP